MYKQLVEGGSSLNEIEETDYYLMLSVYSSDDKKKKKEVPLEEFLGRI